MPHPSRGPLAPRHLALVLLPLLALAAEATSPVRPSAPSGQASALEGTVRTGEGVAAAGALVTAARAGSPLSLTVYADEDGRWRFRELPEGTWELRAALPGREPGAAWTVRLPSEERVDLQASTAVALARLPAAAFLGLLPEGAERRRFILDCTGCHVFDERIALPAGEPRAASSWRDAVGRMLGFAGPQSGFPVIGGGREPEGTATWLARHVTTAGVAALDAPAPVAVGRAEIAEYAMPEPTDLPHDVAVDGEGRVVITGMMSGAMWVLDPAAARFQEVPIPLEGVANANPRAVELDGSGAWWVLLGGPMTVGRRSPEGAWAFWPIGMYPHSIALEPEGGGVWYNGHFSRDPEVVARLDPVSGAVRTEEVPPHPDRSLAAGPMPYELRVGPEGRVWGSELLGGRVFSLDPGTGAFRLHDMPEKHAGPRRLDVGPDGSVWIPLYGAGQLARLDPGSGALETWDLPVPAAGPYVARVDPLTGVVWVGTGAADAVFAFHPGEERFTTYPLPTAGALVRHMVVVPGREVWLAYGASPGVPARVARLRPGPPG